MFTPLENLTMLQWWDKNLNFSGKNGQIKTTPFLTGFSAERLIKLTRDLIKIDSQNPPGSERKIAFFIKDLLKKSGLSTELLEFGKNRFSTLTVLRGSSHKISLLLTPHLDTVPFGKNWNYPPLAAQIYKNRIYGRGATDCKGNLAVGLEVLRNLAEDKIKFNYDIVFLATADEEAGSEHGLLPILKQKLIRPDFALILDADYFNIIVAQKGLLHIKISISGKKAHGAYPERGLNAIELCTELINKVKKIKFKYKKHKLLKPPTINIGTIKGGDKVNMVPDWCELELDIRFLPEMRKEQIIKTIKHAIISIPRLRKFKFEITAQQAPCQIGPNHVLVRSLKEASIKTIGKYRLKGSEGATVMTFFDRYGIPSVATGFGSAKCAHTTDEYVEIDNLISGYNMLRKFLFIFDRFVK